MQYCSIDFETTGLNPLSDDPIQIGLIIFDLQWTIKASYQSLIAPSQHSEFKDIVQYVTWLDQSLLKHAPSQAIVFHEIEQYLQAPTIFIGHNINFDITILQRFLPSIDISRSIDTFDCARQLIHFQKSYALDALIAQDDQQKLWIFWPIVWKAHDAMYDATASMQLFLRWYRTIWLLNKQYPRLMISLTKYTITKQIFNTSELPYNWSIPSFKQYQKQTQKVLSPLTDASHHLTHLIKKYYNHIPLIIACNHSSKLTIIKSLLDKIGVVAHDSVHDLPMLNQQNVQHFLQKSTYERWELGFLIKYAHQHQLGHSMVDCKSLDDYRVLHSISDTSSQQLSGITLATHQHIWQFANKITPETTIVFLDHDHRLHSYLHHVQQPIDLLYIINLIDQLRYRVALEQHINLANIISQIVIQVTIRYGRYHSYISHYITGHTATEVDIIDLSSDTFDDTCYRHLVEINNYIQLHHTQISTYHQGQLFLAQRSHVRSILHEPYRIIKKTYMDQRYVIIQSPAIHVDYEDFESSLPLATYHYIKTTEQPLQQTSLNIQTLDQDFKKLISMIERHQNLFILCQSKQYAQGLFQRCMQQKLNQTYEILVENITWWTGKSLIFAKKTKKTIIMIGSEQFYYQAVGYSINIGQIWLWYYPPERKDQIIKDLQFYSL
jgi:DNA polymerase III epsilon subunit-like protein